MTYAAGIKHCNLSIPMEVGIYKVYTLRIAEKYLKNKYKNVNDF
jgi:hypothetical protein